jgi:hypothetical protein
MRKTFSPLSTTSTLPTLSWAHMTFPGSRDTTRTRPGLPLCMAAYELVSISPRWWSSCVVFLGDSTSSYDEVYTGSGAKCGSYCKIDNGGGGGDDGDDILEKEFNGSSNLIMLTVIPVGCIIVLMFMFYGANYSVDKKFANDPALVGYGQDTEDENCRLSTRFSQHSRRNL